MIDIDWRRFMGIETEILSYQDKEDLYETVAWFNPDVNLNKDYLIHFIRVTQEILKFKNDQVNSLTNELDEVAIKQGEVESSKLHLFRDEMNQLREELNWYKKLDKNPNNETNFYDENLKQKVIKLKNENDELLMEISEKEKDLVFEKKEVERYASLLASVEREKEELCRELKTLQEEGTEKSFRSLKNSPKSEEKNSETLAELIKQKNKHISQLLEDVEAIEEENWALRNKISVIKDELAETATSMSEITDELSKLKYLNEEYEKNETHLKEKINSLMCQIEELVEDKEKHNKQLDEYVSVFNRKVEELKEVVECKDIEILKLKEEYRCLCSSINCYSTTNVGDFNLNKKIMQQNEQIVVLQQELQRATEEINASTEIIEKLKEKQTTMNSVPGTDRNVLNVFEEKIKVLEEKLMYAEGDAQLKAEEASDLIIQIREYESKVFGLPEAVAKIKRLEKTIYKKDLQIEKLIDVCNGFELTISSLEEQNLVFRERLGLSASDEIDTSGVLLKFKKTQEIVKTLEKELELKEEELIGTKLMYRKVMTNNERFLRNFEENSNRFAKENDKVDEKFVVKMDLILKENDALRKGMHEILESIREQNSTGTVQVQSSCLERLLEALDSRHISGWYHPAMRLQAQLNTEEGKNDELRNQIRFLKAEERKKASELQNAYLKIRNLENDMPNYAVEENQENKQKMIENVKEENSIETAKEMKRSSMDVARERRIIETESQFHKLKLDYDTAMAETEKKERSFTYDKGELLSRVEALQLELNLLKNEKLDVKDIAETRAQIEVLNRKINHLKSMDCEHRENHEKLRREFIEEERRMLLDILKLQNDKIELVDEIDRLEEVLMNTVPLEQFTTLKKELSSVMSKYKKALTVSLVSDESESAENLRAEISLLETEKQQIRQELKKTKEKLAIAEALIKEETVTKGDLTDEVSALATKLAASEVRELDEKQKSNHLDKMNDALKSQLKDLERRNKELLEKVLKLTEENFKYQETERKLRGDTLTQGIPTVEEHAELKTKIDNHERKINELTRELENIEELLEISQGQCRAFQEWKNEDRILIGIQREEILQLQASSEDKESLSRLTHELATAKLKYSELEKKNEDLKMKMTRVLSKMLGLENQMKENRNQVFELKKKHLTQVRFFYETIDEVRNLYACNFTFRDLEDVFNKKAELKNEKKVLAVEAKHLKIQSEEYLLKKEEMETQLENLEDLKNALKGDAKNLVTWHNKITTVRLKEAKSRRQNEFLFEEVSHLRNSVDRLNDEIAALEEENLNRERNWEEKRRFWEQTQLYVDQLLRENGLEANGSHRPLSKTHRDATTDTMDLPALESPVEVEGKNGEDAASLVKEQRKNDGNDVMIKSLDEFEEEPALELTIINDANYKENVEPEEKHILTMTIDNLESVLKQKEDTILRYRDLLKEERKEYEKAYSKLEFEVNTLNERLALQGKAYNRLKEATRTNTVGSDDVSSIVEKYITRIQELEEELRDYQMTLSNLSTQARFTQEEMDKWKTLAAERSMQLEDFKKKMETDHRREVENLAREIKGYQSEIERLKEIPEHDGKYLACEIGRRSNETGGKPEEDKSEESAAGFPLPREKFRCKSTDDPILREVECLKKQLKSVKSESNHLREQIRLLESRPQKRQRSAGSTTTRSEGLTSKIKNLEELLTATKEREKELIESADKKMKSVEEVARWDERKKSERLVKNLSGKLKEKEAEVATLINKNETFRNMVHKFERDKSVLESQLKTLKGNSEVLNSRIEKLKREKLEVEDSVRELKRKMEEQKRHESGVGAALLHEKLEAQERKLALMSLASRSQSSLVEDLEKLQTVNSKLEKLNLKLEGENLCLRLKLEKEKVDRLQSSESLEVREVRPEEGNAGQRTRKSCFCDSFKVKKTDYEKLKEDHEHLKQKYVESTKKNMLLEDEIKSYKYQIHLMEQKDFAQVITSINTNCGCELSRQVEELKSQLAHKNELLGRVKILLMKAAAKEKSMQKEVNSFEFDLCDENGNLVFIYEKEPWSYGTEYLLTKITYFVVLFERDEENRVVNPMLYVPEFFRKTSTQFSEMMMKIKKQLNPVQNGSSSSSSKGGRPGKTRSTSSTLAK